MIFVCTPLVPWCAPKGAMRETRLLTSSGLSSTVKLYNDERRLVVFSLRLFAVRNIEWPICPSAAEQRRWTIIMDRA
jgi:hypothetical protein